MRLLKAAVCGLFFCFVAPPTSAQMYRCTVAGAITYQDKPCADGTQKIVANPATGSAEVPKTDFDLARQRAENDMNNAIRAGKAQDQRNREEAKRFDAEWPAQKKAMEKALADAVIKFQAQEKEKIAELRKCVNRDIDADCSAAGYRRTLRAMHRSDVESVLGMGKTQLIGSQELLYFSVPIFENRGWRTGRIQVQLGYDSSLPKGIRGAANRVVELNVY